MNDRPFSFGENQQPFGQPMPVGVQRAQLQYPLDAQSEGALKLTLENVEKDVIRRRNRYPLHLDTTRTSFDVGSDYMVMTADSTTNIARIGGGREGQILTLQFGDSDIVLVDNDTADPNAINLSAAFTSSPNDMMQLHYDGTSWREVSRSIN